MKKHIVYLVLGVILICAFILRIWQLGAIPEGISNDEVVRAYNAYSMWETGGYTADGRFFPVSTSSDGQDLSPVSFYLSAPFTGIFGLSLFTARLPYALVGVATVYVLYLLGSQLFNNRIGLFSSFVLAVSPWHLIVSRGLWDAGVSLFFYVLGIYVFVKYVGTRKVLLSLPILALALYSYHGTIIFFVLLIAALLIIYRDTLLQQKKQAIMYAAGIVLCLVPMMIVIFSGSLGRESVLFWKDVSVLNAAQETVDHEREKSEGPMIIRSIFNNKATYFLREVSDNYLTAFSFDHLFLKGDISRINAYGNYSWGAMHFIELPLLLFGIFVVLKSKNNKSKVLVSMGLLLAPITSALILMDRSYMFRSIMMLPFLSLFVGVGISSVFSLSIVRRKHIVCLALILVSGIYVFFIAKNVYSYFYQYGVYGGEYLFKSSRDVAEFVDQKKSQYNQVYVLSPEYYFVLQYAFYNTVDPEIIQSIWNDENKEIGNVILMSSCMNDEWFNGDREDSSLYVAPVSCTYPVEPKSTINDIEEPLRKLWNIYEVR